MPFKDPQRKRDYSRQQSARYYAADPEKYREKARLWREAHPEVIAAQAARRDNKSYYEANKDRIKDRVAAYKIANPEKTTAAVKSAYSKNREKYLAKKLQWQKDNRHIANANWQAYKAAKIGSIPKWANIRNIAAVQAHARRVSKCLGIKYHVDHVVPLRSKLVCGLHCEQNLQLLPALLNNSKGNRRWPDMPEN